MTARISIEPFVGDQQQIKFYGRRVGYCGTKKNMPITFLTDSKNQCGLNQEEKTEVITHVIGELSSVKKTPQTAPYWPETPEVSNEQERDDEQGTNTKGNPGGG